jgi:hypothetical protein
MITRRNLTQGLAAYPLIGCVLPAFGQPAEDADLTFDQLIYPPIEALDDPQPFGYKPATEAQKKRAREIVDGTPKGPRPIDIAQSFVDSFYAKEPDAISQWPAPANWNPLIVDFFGATSYRANNDMIAWCAAFANWNAREEQAAEARLRNHSCPRISRQPTTQSLAISQYLPAMTRRQEKA